MSSDQSSTSTFMHQHPSGSNPILEGYTTSLLHRELNVAGLSHPWLQMETQLKKIQHEAQKLCNDSSLAAAPHVRVELLRQFLQVSNEQAELYQVLKQDWLERKLSEGVAKREVVSLKAQLFERTGILELACARMHNDKERHQNELKGLRSFHLEQMKQAHHLSSTRLEAAIREGADHDAKAKEASAALERSNLRVAELENSQKESIATIESLQVSLRDLSIEMEESKEIGRWWEQEMLQSQEMLSIMRKERQTEIVEHQSALQMEKHRILQVETQLASVRSDAKATENEYVLSRRELALSLVLSRENLKNAHAIARQQADALRQQLTTAEEQLKATEANLCNRVSSLGTSVRQLKHEVDDLRQQLSSAEEEGNRTKVLHAKEVDDLQGQLSTAQKQLKETMESHAKVVNELRLQVEKDATQVRKDHEKQVHDLRLKAQKEANEAKEKHTKRVNDFYIQMLKDLNEAEKKHKEEADSLNHQLRTAKEKTAEAAKIHETQAKDLLQAQKKLSEAKTRHEKQVQETHAKQLASLVATLRHHDIAHLVVNSNSYTLRPTKGFIDLWQHVCRLNKSIAPLPAELAVHTHSVIPTVNDLLVSLSARSKFQIERIRNLEQYLHEKEQYITHIIRGLKPVNSTSEKEAPRAPMSSNPTDTSHPNSSALKRSSGAEEGPAAKRPRTSASEYVTTDPRLRKGQPSQTTTDPRKRPPLDIQTSPTIKNPRPQQTALPPQSDPTLGLRPAHPRTDSNGMSTSAGPGRPTPVNRSSMPS